MASSHSPPKPITAHMRIIIKPRRQQGRGELLLFAAFAHKLQAAAFYLRGVAREFDLNVHTRAQPWRTGCTNSLACLPPPARKAHNNPYEDACGFTHACMLALLAARNCLAATAAARAPRGCSVLVPAAACCYPTRLYRFVPCSAGTKCHLQNPQFRRRRI